MRNLALSAFACLCWGLVFGIEAEASKIYWTSTDSNRIYRANLDGSNVEIVASVNADHPRGVRIDATGGKVYWSTQINDVLARADFDGSNAEVLTTSIDNPAQGAVDSIGGKMYWQNSINTQIEIMNLDATGRQIMFFSGPSTFTRIQGLAINTELNKLYWADPEADNIKRVNLNGTNLETLATGIGTDIWHTAFDYTNDKMYFTDATSGKISRANFDGTNIEDVITGLTFPSGISIDSANGKIYWSSWTGDAIFRANLDGSNQETLVSGVNAGGAFSIDLLLDNTTAPGDEVVGLGGFSVTFDNVSTAGITTIQEVDSGTLSSILADPLVLEIMGGSFKNVSTTAGVSGIHTIAIPYNEADIPLGYSEGSLRLLHYTGGSVVDITTSVDTINNILYGQTNAFSPFGAGFTTPEPGTLLILLLSLLGYFPFRKIARK